MDKTTKKVTVPKVTQRLVIAPISSKAKKAKNQPCSRTDFREQLERNEPILNGNRFYTWDDTKRNLAKAGDYFAFWIHEGEYREGTTCAWIGGTFIFHRIVEVHSPAHRLESWHRNVGQTDRQVLALSPPLATLTYAMATQAHGMKPDFHGTHYAKSGFNAHQTSLKTFLDQCDKSTLPEVQPEVQPVDPVDPLEDADYEYDEDPCEVEWDMTHMAAELVP